MVAWLALAVSLSTLMWQVVSWRRSGARVRVWCEALCFGDEAYVEVHILNTGRFATTVKEAGYRLMPGRRPVEGKTQYWASDESDLPYRLEGHEEITVKVPLAEDRRLAELAAENPAWNLFPYVYAGGRLIFGERDPEFRRHLAKV